MPKDRLHALKRVQAQIGHGDDEDHVALVMDRGGFMEDFFELTDEIRSLIGEIAENVQEVKLKHSTILSTPQANDQTEKELEELIQEIKRKATNVLEKLKVIEQGIKEERETKSSTAGFRIRTNQYSTLTGKFKEVMKEYSACQVDYRDRCKDRIQRQMEIVGKTITDEELEDMIESRNPAVFTQEIMTQTQEAKQSLRVIEERHKDIVKLEISIQHVNEMFLTIAWMVQSGGDMLDRIEHHVVSAAEHVAGADSNLKKAVKCQRSARQKRNTLLLIVIPLLVALIVIIIVVAATA